MNGKGENTYNVPTVYSPEESIMKAKNIGQARTIDENDESPTGFAKSVEDS